MQNRYGVSYFWIYFPESDIKKKKRGKIFFLLIKIANNHISTSPFFLFG